jgi:hypothetical protein
MFTVMTHGQLGEVFHSLASGFASLRAHQHNQLFHVRARVQQLLDQHFSHEARSTGDENRFSSIKLLHRIQLRHLALLATSTKTFDRKLFFFFSSSETTFPDRAGPSRDFKW